jgi:hypothetical protein
MFRLALAAVFVLTAGILPARADVYTWTDADGKINVSNLTPPDGANVSSVVHESPRPPAPPSVVVAAAPPQPEIQFLADRVRQLEYEVDFARRQGPPPMQYASLPPPPVMQYAPDPEPPVTSYGCDQAWNGWNGCLNGWGFGSYPVGVVVLTAPNFHHRPFPGRGFHRSPMVKTQMQMPVRSRGTPPRR